MKAFEEWLDKQHPNWTGILISTGEEAWKAALEWVLSKQEDFEEGWKLIEATRSDKIEKELNPDS